MKVIDILKEMKVKGFAADTMVDLSFKDGNVARCTLGDSEPFANMSGKLTSYYSIKEMLGMNLIAIDDVGD